MCVISWAEQSVRCPERYILQQSRSCAKSFCTSVLFHSVGAYCCLIMSCIPTLGLVLLFSATSVAGTGGEWLRNWYNTCRERILFHCRRWWWLHYWVCESGGAGCCEDRDWEKSGPATLTTPLLAECDCHCCRGSLLLHQHRFLLLVSQ